MGRDQHRDKDLMIRRIGGKSIRRAVTFLVRKTGDTGEGGAVEREKRNGIGKKAGAGSNMVGEGI